MSQSTTRWNNTALLHHNENNPSQTHYRVDKMWTLTPQTDRINEFPASKVWSTNHRWTKRFHSDDGMYGSTTHLQQSSLWLLHPRETFRRVASENRRSKPLFHRPLILSSNDLTAAGEARSMVEEASVNVTRRCREAIIKDLKNEKSDLTKL